MAEVAIKNAAPIRALRLLFDIVFSLCFVLEINAVFLCFAKEKQPKERRLEQITSIPIFSKILTKLNL